MNRGNNNYSSQRGNDARGEDQSIGKKVFVGGLPPTCTKEDLEKHFGAYGEITDVVVMTDPQTQRSRGFGFVTFSEVKAVDDIQKARPHEIQGKQIDTKRAQPRGQSNANSNDSKTPNKKVFVRGLPSDLNDEDFKAYAMSFGEVDSVFINRKDGNTSSTCFGFITFVDFDDADKMALHQNHSINGKSITVQKSLVKPRTQPNGQGQMQQPQQGGYQNNNRQYGGYQQGNNYNPNPAQNYQPYYQNNQNSYMPPQQQQYGQNQYNTQQSYGRNNQGPGYSPYQGGYNSENKPQQSNSYPSQTPYGRPAQNGGYATQPPTGYAGYRK